MIINDYSSWGETGKEVLAEMREGMHDRINRHLPWANSEKWQYHFQTALWIDARKINQKINHGVIIRELNTSFFLKRYWHLVTPRSEYYE